ncbi:MAG: hypothetical protein Q9201_005324 [Fulgogasparrea decipioides]
METSESDDSTIPITPEADSDDFIRLDENEVFAWLRLVDGTARRAFDKTVNTVIKHAPKFDHFRQFLHCDYRQDRSQSAFTKDGDSIYDQPSATLYQWAGAFALRLTCLPHDPVQGWCMGTNHGRSPSKEVDLLLAPPTYDWTKTRILGHHATLKLHPESCRVSLHAKHTTTITRHGIKAFRHPESYVLEHGEIIIMGDCAFTFEYTDFFHSHSFEQDLTQYMREYHHPQWIINKYISPGSVGLPTVIGDYYCSPSAFDQGTFGKVSAGWTRSGGPVAIKTFKNPKKSEIYSHKELMEYIGRHDNIVHLLTCVSHFETKAPDAYCIYTPLALFNLSTVIMECTPDTTAKSALFTDYLSGLAYLHEQKGIMHRDISPGNLAVTSLHAPKGIILDLDAATTSISSTDHMKGTLPCLAPEIVALKAWDRSKVGKPPPPYEKNIDTWALGLLMYALYTGQSFAWVLFHVVTSKPSVTVTPQAYRGFQEKLEENSRNAKDPETQMALNLIGEMTAWESVDRNPASDTLRRMSEARPSQARGTIVAKEHRKRRRADD